MKPPRALWILAIALGLIGYVVAPYFVGESAEDRSAFLHDVAEQINTDLPSQVDESTRLESTTVDGETLLLETHVFDFDGDLYGQRLQIDFVQRIRPEQRFKSTAELVEQIRKDAALARAALD